jgi:hypothetical protein
MPQRASGWNAHRHKSAQACLDQPREKNPFNFLHLFPETAGWIKSSRFIHRVPKEKSSNFSVGEGVIKGNEVRSMKQS